MLMGISGNQAGIHSKPFTANQIGRNAGRNPALKHLPEDQHTGYMGPQACKSKDMEVPNILFSAKADTLH